EGQYDPPAQVTVAPDMSEILDAPARKPVVDGDAIAESSVTSGKLTVDAVSNFVNGRFEDVNTGTQFFASPFPAWALSWPLGEYDLSRIAVVAEGAQIAGSKSMGIELDAGATGRMVGAVSPYPVLPNSMVEVTALVRASRAVTGSPVAI